MKKITRVLLDDGNFNKEPVGQSFLYLMYT